MRTKSMQRSIMGKKTGLSMHPRKFGNHVTPQNHENWRLENEKC